MNTYKIRWHRYWFDEGAEVVQAESLEEAEKMVKDEIDAFNAWGPKRRALEKWQGKHTEAEHTEIDEVFGWIVDEEPK
jgi:hypothetical protein